MNDLTATKGKIIPKINREWCKGCGICVAFCLKVALVLDELEKAYLADSEKCNSCGICELYCPDLAIELKEVFNENG